MRGKTIIFYLLLSAGLGGCTTSISEIGSDFFTKNTFDIAYLDSITLKVSTVLRDSMVTSNTKRLLVGYHEDEKLGTVTSQGIFQPGISNAVTLDEKTTEYLALRLHLKKDGYYFYDTTKSQTISAYRLTKGITSINGFYYNTSKFTIDQSGPLGSLTFLPRPKHTTDSIEIPLPDDLGRQLMTMAQKSDFRLASNTDFIKFFKGLALLPDTIDSRAIVGFTSAPEMRLYYQDVSTVPTTEKFVRFGLASNSYFSNIHSSRAATHLNSLQKAKQMVTSTVTENESYVQCGTGLAMRIEIPHLRALLNTDRNFLCTRAILEAVPVKGSYLTNPLPAAMRMYVVDAENNLLSASAGTLGYVKDLDLGRSSAYKADVTAFVNAQIQTDLNNKNALLILLDDTQYRSTVDRVYLGDQKNQYAMKIKLFYLTLSNEPN
jgi:hypothetical protein